MARQLTLAASSKGLEMLASLAITAIWIAVLTLVLWDALWLDSGKWTHQKKIGALGVLLNFVTFVAAIGGVVVAYGAFGESRRQADAAESQIDIAKDTARRQLRAYAYVTLGNITNLGTPERPKGVASVQMIGQTPAYRLEFITNIATLPYPLKEPMRKFEPPGRPIEVTRSVLFPGQSFSHTVQLAYVPDPQQIALLKNAQQARFYLCGTVKYADAFSDRHEVLFCFNYDQEAISGSSGPQICDQHVEAN